MPIHEVHGFPVSTPNLNVTRSKVTLDGGATYIDLVDAIATAEESGALTLHTANTSNPHAVTKSQIGLGNADNTSDANKPVSTAQQAAIDAVGDYTGAGTGTTTRTVQERLDDLPVSIRDYTGGEMDNTGNGTAALQNALDAAALNPYNALGGEVALPNGTIILSSMLNLQNRVRVRGINKRGAHLKADASHTGPAMFSVVNGTTSMFDNGLIDCYLDCNDVAGLSGVISDAWQEGGGARYCLIHKFRDYGIYLRNGYGGASLVEISACEIFGADVANVDAGIYVEQISLVGNFMLKVTNTSITGGSGSNIMDYGIYLEGDSLHAHVVHFEHVTSGIYIDGPGHHTLIGVTGGPNVTNVIEIASTFTGTLTMRGCLRGPATNLVLDNRSGGYGAIAYDTDIVIRQRPPVGRGETNSCGTFNGTAVATTNTFGVSGIVKNATGDYTITETNARPSAQAVVLASSNISGGSVTVTLISTTTFKIELFNSAGAASDANEIKFHCVRI